MDEPAQELYEVWCEVMAHEGFLHVNGRRHRLWFQLMEGEQRAWYAVAQRAETWAGVED